MSKIKVGIVGTGYTANKRAEAIEADERAELIAVAGSSAYRVKEFAKKFEITAVDSWQELVEAELDLIFVCTVNCLHGEIAAAALAANKHVVVEYPLALAPQQAEKIIELANQKNKLVHVEHIELLGGLHQTIKQNLSEIGKVFYARYATISPQRDVNQNWKYHRTEFGFPLTAALYETGAGLMQIAVFISSLMAVGIVTLPVEIKYFGRKVSIVRNGLTFIYCFVVAILMRGVLV